MVYLMDMQNEDIEGAFYPDEIQEVEWDGKKTVSHIVKTEKDVDGREYKLVSYWGWPDKSNEWIPV